MKEWRWVSPSLVYAVHDMQLDRHGGLSGLRSKDAVEAALARPRVLFFYGAPDVSDLAASYAYGLARSHGFSDGNKRTAWIVAQVFLADNGATLRFTETDAIQIMQNVAAGNITEPEFSQWFRRRLI